MNDKNKTDSFEYELLNEVSDVASATECTGLMPTPPQNSAENEAYSEICVVPNMMEKTAPHKKRYDGKRRTGKNPIS